MKQELMRNFSFLFSILLFSCFFVSVSANDSDGDGFFDVDDDCPYSNGYSNLRYTAIQ